MADLTPLVSALSLRKLCGKDTVTYHGVYAGDLLSRAMSHVKAGNLWITIMNNMNVIAVASLTEDAAVLLAEGVSLPEEVQKAAEEEGITVWQSDADVYHICQAIAKENPTL